MSLPYRQKTADYVVEHFIEKLLRGELRSGDRIDINSLADELEMSRAPIREGLVMLERDGLVSLPLHKGAFVGDFDETTIVEAFELYGMLSGVASSRVAQHRTKAELAQLNRLANAALTASDPNDFEVSAREFRRKINSLGAGPRLRALIQTFGGLIPAASRITVANVPESERSFIDQERLAIELQDPTAAARAIEEHVRLLQSNAVTELRRRGVF